MDSLDAQAYYSQDENRAVYTKEQVDSIASYYFLKGVHAITSASRTGEGRKAILNAKLEQVGDTWRCQYHPHNTYTDSTSLVVQFLTNRYAICPDCFLEITGDMTQDPLFLPPYANMPSFVSVDWMNVHLQSLPYVEPRHSPEQIIDRLSALNITIVEFIQHQTIPDDFNIDTFCNDIKNLAQLMRTTETFEDPDLIDLLQMSQTNIEMCISRLNNIPGFEDIAARLQEESFVTAVRT